MKIQQIYGKINSYWWSKYVLIFLFITVLFSVFQISAAFGDPDAFYHARISEIMIHDIFIDNNFPWMQFSTFNQDFADHHFLYHLLLIPFVLIFTPLWGVKIAGILLAAAFITDMKLTPDSCFLPKANASLLLTFENVRVSFKYC